VGRNAVVKSAGRQAGRCAPCAVTVVRSSGASPVVSVIAGDQTRCGSIGAGAAEAGGR